MYKTLQVNYLNRSLNIQFSPIDTVLIENWFESIFVDEFQYPRINSDHFDFYLNRIIAQRFLNTNESFVIHKNGNFLDCTRENLTVKSYNKERLESQKFLGVTKSRNKFRARIKVNGVLKHLGYFDTKLDAAVAFNYATEKLKPKFSEFNDELIGLPFTYSHEDLEFFKTLETAI